MSHRVLTLDAAALNSLRATPALLKIDWADCVQCAQLDPIWEALSVSIVKVVGEIATFRLSCADEPALCAAFAVPPSTKPTFGVLAGDAQNTLLPYRGEWNSDALSEWLAETARAAKDQIAMAYADDVLRDAFAGRAAAAYAGLVTAAPEGACPAASRPSARALSFFHQRFQLQLAGGRIALRMVEAVRAAPSFRIGEMQPTYERVARPRALAELAAFNSYLHASGSAWDAGFTGEDVVRVARRAMVLASTDWTVHFRHMRKAGGTAVRNFLRANSSCGNMLEHEWHPTVFPAHEGGSERFSSGITHFRDPIARIVSAYIFEGMAPGCWEDAWNASGTSSCVPRYQQSGVATFRAYLDDGRADAEGALLDQGMRCAGSSDGTVTAPECAGRRFGRRYISNYYLKTLLYSWPHDCGDVLAEPLSPCHVDAALRVVDAAFPCFVLFDGGGGAPRMSAACADLERRCDVDTSSQPWPWPMQRWSPDGHEHVLGTDPTDAEVERLRRLRQKEVRRAAALPPTAAQRGHASECMEFGAQLYDALPDVIAELEEENRYDILLFERLRALCPTGRPEGRSNAAVPRPERRSKVD